jgi:hypothetical protein
VSVQRFTPLKRNQVVFGTEGWTTRLSPALQNPELKALTVVATYGGFQHFRLPRLRSSAVYGFAQVQNTEAQPGSAFHQSNYTTGNPIWSPYGSLTLGMEFLYGWRVNEVGSSGNAPRIMFSAKYSFVRVQSTE